MRFLKAFGGERSRNVLDALAERLEKKQRHRRQPAPFVVCNTGVPGRANECRS
jgi:hypothetical protein